jgi:sugar-phosphatase
MIFECEAIIFDLDGVLVDSTEVVERAWREWAVDLGLDPALVLPVAHGRRSMETIQLFAPHLDALVEAELFEEKEIGFSEGISVIEGAPGLLAGLPPGRWAIVTSGTYPTATARLAAVGLPIPPILVTGSDVQRGKPDPQGYLLAGIRLGALPGSCLVIEDSPAGISAAKAAGMQAIGITTTYPAEELALADAIISRLAELVVTSCGGAGSARLRVEVGQDQGNTA